MQPKPVTLEYFTLPRQETSQGQPPGFGNAISLGSRKAAVKWDPIRREYDHLFSRWYYCHQCGHIYGAIVVQPASKWSLEMGVCDDCPLGGFTHLVPGSLLKQYSISHLNTLPLNLLKHEFDRALEWALKEYKDELTIHS